MRGARVCGGGEGSSGQRLAWERASCVQGTNRTAVSGAMSREAREVLGEVGGAAPCRAFFIFSRQLEPTGGIQWGEAASFIQISPSGLQQNPQSTPWPSRSLPWICPSYTNLFTVSCTS